MASVSLLAQRTVKATSSLCPLCLRQIPAEVFERDGRVFMRKHCPEHGGFEVLINSNVRHYHLSHGAASGGACCGGAGCGATESATSDDAAVNAEAASHPGAKAQGLPSLGFGHDPTIVERAQTCIALVEIVDSCNLKCPTCYADSPFSPPEAVQALSIEEFAARIDAVLKRKKVIDILQLSGGEPTIHPRFFDLFEAVLAEPRIGYILLNTNGVRLAHDEAFMSRLGALHRGGRRFEVYLQFDGPQEAGQADLRGADLRGLRRQAIASCGRWGIPVTLAMTVTPHNLAHLGDTVRFGLEHDAVRGITFQPMFTSGRTPRPAATTPAASAGALSLPIVDGSNGKTITAATANAAALTPANLNVADIIAALIAQSDGLLSEGDFTPLPCGDPNCHTIGYVLRRGGERIPVSQLIDFASVQGFLKDRINFNVADLERCGCDSEPLGRMLKQLEIGPDHVFRMFIKPFMDAWTYDQDRVDRCCVHVIGAGGALESFCRHYAMRGH